jgi:dTDP-4-dehydrorhamnose reductase
MTHIIIFGAGGQLGRELSYYSLKLTRFIIRINQELHMILTTQNL